MTSDFSRQLILILRAHSLAFLGSGAWAQVSEETQNLVIFRATLGLPLPTGKRLLLARIESLQQTRLLLLILSSCGKLPSEFMTPPKKNSCKAATRIHIHRMARKWKSIIIFVYLFIFIFADWMSHSPPSPRLYHWSFSIVDILLPCNNRNHKWVFITLRSASPWSRAPPLAGRVRKLQQGSETHH